MSVTEKDLEEFGRFAAKQLKNGGAESLQELVSEWDKLQRWNERNAVSGEQSRQGLSKPLDLAGVLERVERRVADHGTTELLENIRRCARLCAPCARLCAP